MSSFQRRKLSEMVANDLEKVDYRELKVIFEEDFEENDGMNKHSLVRFLSIVSQLIISY